MTNSYIFAIQQLTSAIFVIFESFQEYFNHMIMYMKQMKPEISGILNILKYQRLQTKLDLTLQF